jgi:hypothetical protein
VTGPATLSTPPPTATVATVSFQRVSYKLNGPVDQPTLNRLRAALALDRQGRLADDRNQLFGGRRVDLGGGTVEFLLVRDESRPGWNVDLSTSGEPPSIAVERFEADIVAAAAASGLTVQSVFRV